MAVDTKKIDSILKRYRKCQASLIPVLQDIQREFNFLPCDALKAVSEKLELPLSKVFSVSTFYKAFSLNPRGERVIRLCVGTACHVRGAGVLYDRLQALLKIKDRETTKDGRFSLELVNCVGTCAMAPVIVADETFHGSLKPGDVDGILEKGYK